MLTQPQRAGPSGRSATPSVGAIFRTDGKSWPAIGAAGGPAKSTLPPGLSNEPVRA
jgi:hypothetical protein